MEQEIAKELLLNITPLKWLLCWGIGAVAIIFRFGMDLNSGIKKDPSTPYKWSWRHFLYGFFVRFLGSLFLMALLVARFPEFAPLLVNVGVPEGVNVSVGITIGTSALFGFNIDVLWKKIAGITKQGGTTVINKLKNGNGLHL